MSILVSAHAGRQGDHGKLSYIAGLLICNFEKGSIFHTLFRTSHKSKRPVKSIGSAEILSAGEAIGEGKFQVQVISTLLGINSDLIIALDTKNLYNSLSTQHNALDKPIRADVNVIQYELETRKVNRMIWIPGCINLTGPELNPTALQDKRYNF